MSNRYKPNEATSPVPLDTLALLLRSDESQLQRIVGAMRPLDRARLAVFCVSRCHMRQLGLDIAEHCDERSMTQAAGLVGETILDQTRNRGDFDQGPSVYHKKPVTLARFAA